MRALSRSSNSAFETAIVSGDVEKVNALRKAGAKPMPLAILLALKNDQPGLVPLLARAGCKVDEKDGYGGTALDYALQFSPSSAVKDLLEAGADPNLEALQVKPLVNAATWGKTESVRLLLEHGADPNGKNPTGLTALLQATEYGYTEIIEMLVKAGADPNYRGPTGLSAIDLAKESGRQDSLEILLSSPKAKKAAKKAAKPKSRARPQTKKARR